MRDIYLVRHGKPAFEGGAKRCIGWTDPELSGEGRRQMEKLSREFAEKSIERIYTSPLKRCVESANILSGGRIPVEVVEDLREIYMGQWENMTFEEIKQKYPAEYEARGRDLAGVPAPGGESFADCERRARRAFEAIRNASRGNVIVMAHVGVNRALISGFEGRKLGDLLEIPQGYGQVYRKTDFIFDAMIVAAGLSSRMGEFKPLMEIGGKTVIRRQVETLRAGGAREIAVITGHRAGEIRAEVSGPGVLFLHNEEFERTKMCDSVSIGLKYCRDKCGTPEGRSLDGIFFLPVDVPLFTRFTMEYEKWRFASGDGDVYCPYNGGAPGHPLLIRASALDFLLAHDGERGLKGAYERLGERVIHLDVTDRGTVMDMDTREDFLRLSAYEAGREIPDEETCEALLAWFKTDGAVVRHCRAVAALAEKIAAECNRAGAGLDLKLVRAGALLHDMAKAYPDHAGTAARWLSMLGHGAAARVVADHMDLPEEKLGGLSESLVVYLADKMTQGEKTVSVEERFEYKRRMFADQPEALAAVGRRRELARRALAIARQGGFSDETD